jgi:hypothetical protein
MNCRIQCSVCNVHISNFLASCRMMHGGGYWLPGGVESHDVLCEVQAAAVVFVEYLEEGVRQQLGVRTKHDLQHFNYSLQKMFFVIGLSWFFPRFRRSRKIFLQC